MDKKTLALFLVLAVLAVIPVFSAQSRTTEYHKTGLKVSKDMTFNITLPDGLFVTGYVKGPTGAAVKGTAGTAIKGAGVFIGNVTEEYSGFSGTTDAAGKFSIPVQPGNKFLDVEPPESGSVEPAQFSRLLGKNVEGITVTDDMSVGDISLQNGFVLSGTVNPPAGSGSLFYFMPTIEIFPIKSLALIDVAQVGGTNQLIFNKYAAALPAGTYRLLTRAVGTTSAYQTVQMLPKVDKVKVNRDTVKNITMSRGGYSFSGTVKDAANRGLDGALYVIPRSGPFKGWDIQAIPVFKGVFGLMPGLNLRNTFIAAGNYLLLFVPSGYAMNTYTGKATVTTYNFTMPSAAKTLALVAKNGFVVSGKVTDARGKATKAAIAAFKKGATLNVDLLELNFMFTLTNAQGKYRFALPADTFNVFAIPQTTAAAPKPEELLRRMILKALSNGSAS